MKKVLAAAAVAALALAPIACNKSPEGGQPGTTNAFTITLPTMSPSLKPGETKTYEVGLDRGKDFKAAVKFEAKPKDDKIKAELSPSEAKEGESPKMTLTLTAAADANEGEHTVTITGTPAGNGAATSKDLTVKVSK